jgi:alpha-galactosidase
MFSASALQRPSLQVSAKIRRVLIVVLSAFYVSAIVAATPAAGDVLASRDDAYVSRDSTTREWAIGSTGLELIVGFSADGVLSLKRLWRPENGEVFRIRTAPEPAVTLNDQDIPLEESGGRTLFLRALSEETESGVRLQLTFEHRTTHALITRSYAAYPGSPTFETWTTVESPANRTRVTQMIGWHLHVPNGRVQWVSGLRAWMPAGSHGAGFTVEGGNLEEGAHVEIGSSRRSSEAYVPLILVETDEHTFYGGVVWSGAWRIATDRFGDLLTLRAEFPDASATASVDRTVEFPHAFFGVTEPSAGSAARALRQFLIGGLRKGRPFLPLVTYNTWFPHGSRIDESKAAEEITRAAGLGVELFVLDAGWYENAGAEHQYDFTSGLGTWRVDSQRFSRGLGILAEHARASGMKFGLWVEPERVALSTVGQPGLAEESWLATQDGTYADASSAQLCLASEAARRWVFDRIVALLDQVRPDYLKWDNNFWINCNRPDHDHEEDDGNYAHVVALYGMLNDLRARYPEMLIENVSGGGNRLDYAMAALTDVGWMDDRTAPSVHVRHNVEGLLLAFPPAYLLSFVLNSEGEPLIGADDFAHIARSRMAGILGLAYHHQELDSDLSGGLRREIAQYKDVRDIISRSYGLLLTSQASADNSWDVIEEIADDRASALIFAFKSDDQQGHVVVRPHQLNPQMVYDVRSLDGGRLGRSTGSQLMLDGIDIVQTEGSRAHVIVLTPAQANP